MPGSALDPFPYNGGTTRPDTLWMGVPSVTLAGRLAAQRLGADILTLAGSPGLVAETPEQYVQAAIVPAQAVPRIPELRRKVRRPPPTSCIMNEAGAVRMAEEDFREMWRAGAAPESHLYNLTRPESSSIYA